MGTVYFDLSVSLFGFIAGRNVELKARMNGRRIILCFSREALVQSCTNLHTGGDTMTRADRTRRIAAAAARQHLSRLLSDVRQDEQPVIIERSGVPVAAMVPLSMLERDRRWNEERSTRLALLERLRRPFREIPATEIEREAEKAVTEARRRRRRSTRR